MSVIWWALIGAAVVVVFGAIASRIWAARRLSKHLDAMQAAEAAKATGRRQEREPPGN